MNALGLAVKKTKHLHLTSLSKWKKPHLRKVTTAGKPHLHFPLMHINLILIQIKQGFTPKDRGLGRLWLSETA